MFPVKPVRIVVGLAPGGGIDTTARMLAQGLGANMGQQFIVDNRGGANGIIAAQMVAKSQPDGYNLLLFTSPVACHALARAALHHGLRPRLSRTEAPSSKP